MIFFSNTGSTTVDVSNSVTSSLSIQGDAYGDIFIRQSVTDGTLDVNGAFNSNDGAINLFADNMVMSTGGAINSGSGLITLIGNDTTRNISIGSTLTSGATNITADFLNNLSTSNGLTIGSSTFLGDITVDGTVNNTTISGGVFSLLTDADIFINGSLTNIVETSLISGSGNVSLNGDLESTEDVYVQTNLGNILFGDGVSITSSNGNIILNSAGSIAGSGAITFNALAGLLTSGEMILGGDTLVNVDALNIQQNITTTSGDLTFTSVNPITINPAIVLSAADTLSLSAFDANGDLNLNAGNGVILSAETNINNSGDLMINAGDGSLEILANLVGSGNLTAIAGDLEIDTTNAAISVSGVFSLSDQDTGNGVGLATFQPGKLNLDINEYNTITAASLEILSNNNVTLVGDFTSVASLIPLTIDTSSLLMDGTTQIALGGDLSFADSTVTVTGALDINIGGSFAMDGAISATNTVTIHSATGINMGAPSSISTTNDPINLITDTQDVLLGLLNSGSANVSVTASGGDILNYNGVFIDVTDSLTNVKAANVNLSALDRIGISSTDAVTLDIDAAGQITLSFGADHAYINNLQNSIIINNGSGEVVVGLIFSNQIIGIGHNLGLSMSSEVSETSPYDSQGGETIDSDISILGMDFLALLADDEEEDVISSIIPSVPVLIRTLDGWRFESPSRKQKLDHLKENKKKGYKYIDWF